MNMKFYRKLPIPQDVKAEYPVTPEMAEIKQKRDSEIRDVFTGKSSKFILVIGPCSADKSESVLDYISRLRKVADEVADKIIVIPRIYTNKPRTTGDGYKGMLHQPDPNSHPDMLRGIIAIRQLHMSALRDYAFSCADEMLYPDNHRYLSDLLSYVAVGARSVENQQHRLTAAHHPHTFIYRGWEVESTGNPLSHAILRGYQTTDGKNVSNYHYEDLVRLNELYAASKLENPAVIIDTNHANSGKKYEEQIRISEDVLHSMRQNPELRRLCKGLMIESYIVDGNQKTDGTVYGQSITDPCLGWEKTEKLIYEIADKII